MNGSIERQAQRFDAIRWLAVTLIVVGGAYANAVYSSQAMLYRVLVGLALLGLTVAIAMSTALGKATWELAKESRVEIRKVVWPTRDETLQTTLIVVGVVILVSFILWLLDSALSWMIQGVLG